jgi:hypothetical protein
MMAAERERAALAQQAADEQLAKAQRVAERAADPDARRADKEAPQKKACEETRAARVSHAKEAIIARMDAETRLYQHAKAIRASCKLTERKTGAVVMTHGVAGARIAPELADDVKCGALPKGITKDDAYVVLFRDREGNRAPTGPILQPEDASPEDGMCMLHDQAVGLNFRAATFDNPMAITWKPPVTSTPGD